MQVVPLGLAQPVQVELPDLGVLAVGTLVPPVRLAGDDVVGDLVRGFDGVHSREPGGGLGRKDVLVVRVGEVHGLASRVGVDPHGTHKVVGRDKLGHERAVDGDLVDVGASQPGVLGVTVAAVNQPMSATISWLHILAGDPGLTRTLATATRYQAKVRSREPTIQARTRPALRPCGSLQARPLLSPVR